MKKARHNAEPIILWGLFVLYLFTLFKITIFRTSNSGVQSVNLIPFITMMEYFQFMLSGIRIIGIANLLGNFIIFFPLGYMSALLFPKMRKTIKILIAAFCFSVAIEVVQYIFACGATDIDDVLLNTFGGVAGYWFYFLTSRIFKSHKYVICISALMIAVPCLCFFTYSNYRFLVRRPAPGVRPTIVEQPNKPLSTDAAVIDTSQNNTDEPIAEPNPASTEESQSKTDKADDPVGCLVLVNKWNTIPDDPDK